jgi:pyruvate-ferredoxin/flavodoxin oxidoreductase
MPAVTIDANEAVASVAHRLSEVVAIYPITPASAMGELADEWSTHGRKNLWGEVPRVVEMQSEAGAIGAVHGALQAGSLATTFTASQGLLLMIPSMFKIAGELLPMVLHVAARTVATHALSIFCDHSDVMACRSTGFAFLCAGSVQEAQDLAAIAHAATLLSRVPILHFFDGFRTSHEIAKIEPLDDETLRSLISPEGIAAVRQRALTPDRPVLRGTAQNPDTFFQAREASQPFYDAFPTALSQTFERFAALTGRRYRPFDYVGHPEAERVIVTMGSSAECVHETVEWLRDRGERVGVLKVRLFRPWSVADFIAVLPRTVKQLAVLDRTKEPGAVGDPLYLEVVAALTEAVADGLFPQLPQIVAGRYGLSSKEFTPAMVIAIFAELSRSRPRRHFLIGISDDVGHRSLEYDESLRIEPTDVVRAVFFGLGSDGTVGSNKNTIKIIGEETDHFAQGYFVYDSRKSGAVTVSHLRFGPRPIRSSYKIQRAGFVACHQPQLLERFEIAELAEDGATLLLNAPWPVERAFSLLPREVQQLLIARKMRFFIIDAQRVSEEAGLGRMISTVMQTCFFALSGVLPKDVALDKIRQAAQKAYGKRGSEVVRRNLAAIDRTLENLFEVTVPLLPTSQRSRPDLVPATAPDFVQRVTALMLAGHGDHLPVSAFPVDGTWPLGTAVYDRRSLALQIPAWDESICIQCNKCVLICPHAAIRATVFAEEHLAGAPEGFVAVDWKEREAAPGTKFRIQVAPDDCTGCGLCVQFCPAKDKSNPRHKAIDMVPAEPRKPVEQKTFEYFQRLPAPDRRTVHLDVKGSQLLEPLFEFSGACAGCGETPYLKLLTQLFGDRLMVANATGCSSIYGGNLPTTPWSTNRDGRGPAWANSLFEDNAEFGLGFRLSLDAHRGSAQSLLRALASELGDELPTAILSATQDSEAAIAAQRERIVELKQRLTRISRPEAQLLLPMADYLVKKSVWIVGGDGWAYDIGFGGLDHVIASGQDLNLLVLDTEVYSNTGGQQSKSTPIGAAAKFAAAGKELPKKDLGMLAMMYGHVYVARVAMGAKDAHTVKCFLEAESYPGPSLIIAYSHCIAHGYDLAQGAEQQRLAVESGVWPLYRFDPRRLDAGEAPLKLDATPGKARISQYMANEGRFRMVELADPQRYQQLLRAAERDVTMRQAMYQHLQSFKIPGSSPRPEAKPSDGKPIDGGSVKP